MMSTRWGILNFMRKVLTSGPKIELHESAVTNAAQLSVVSQYGIGAIGIRTQLTARGDLTKRHLRLITVERVESLSG